MKMPVQAQIIKKMYDNSYNDIRLKYGLTMNEVMFLLYLDKNNMKNTAREIVEDLVITKSHLSKSIDSLVRSDLITRVQDEYDRKIFRLYIKETAQNIIEELKKREKRIEVIITKGITEVEKKVFDNVLSKMQNNIENYKF